MNEFEWNDLNRSSIITIHYTRWICTSWKRRWFMFIDNAKYYWNDSKWMNVDLPNLTSIISSGLGCSFCYPRSVTLESISKYRILMVFRYSKSSKCPILYWLESSIPVYSIEINFEYCLIDLISFIDVSSILAYRV